MECENRNTEIKKNVPVVYFISDGAGSCKIGVASDIQNRFGTLQVGNANELKILHLEYFETLDSAYEAEREYHAKLSRSRKRGEWYKESAVVNFLNGKLEEEKKVYCCDICDDFNLADLLDFYINGLEFAEKYKLGKFATQESSRRAFESIIPNFMWKCFSCERGKQTVPWAFKNEKN